MEVTITQFRRDLFDLVNQALDGSEVWVTHRGRRFKITPDRSPGTRLSRITPLEVINTKAPKSSLLKEMTQAWESDWSTL